MQAITNRCPLRFLGFMILALCLLLSPLGCADEEEPEPEIEGSIIVPDDYETIQGAIEAAVDGDVIVVRPGRYTERINFLGKGITLRSTDPEDLEIVSETVIDAGGSQTPVTFSSGESERSVISGFTITGGSGTFLTLIFSVDESASEAPDFYGGGILVTDGSAPIIKNNIIIDNIAERGGGVMVHDSNPVIIDNRIVDNRTSGPGGGMVLADSAAEISGNRFGGNVSGTGGGAIFVTGEKGASPLIEKNIFTENSAEFGGGISLLLSDPKINDNRFYNNEAEFRGGAIFIVSAAPQITGNEFADNTGGEFGGAISLNVGSSPTIKENLIYGNRADVGGAISILQLSNPLIEDNTFSDNRAKNGGAVFIHDQSDPRIIRNDFSSNSADLNGAGLFVQEASATVEENTFHRNDARRSGGAIYGILDSSLSVSGNEFQRNQASEGGAMHASRGTSIQLPDPDDNTYEANVPDDIYTE